MRGWLGCSPDRQACVEAREAVWRSACCVSSSAAAWRDALWWCRVHCGCQCREGEEGDASGCGWMRVTPFFPRRTVIFTYARDCGLITNKQRDFSVKTPPTYDINPILFIIRADILPLNLLLSGEGQVCSRFVFKTNL
ncbi:uncharacterized protein LOC119338023 [Triticum dicoccoides]|uniref:uncharacterized protein LOC119338023 n=1 Tax=Triticum dicoccoides TaxID=85692 RepID=UPI0018916A6B|nr:uncharacterized protein LOC119338023 [Triticum dicoccoides]